MQQITVYTLFDITNTGILRRFKPEILPVTKKGLTLTSEEEYNFARKQQSNYEVLTQVMSLRVQLQNIVMYDFSCEDLSAHKFDKKYKGSNNVWKFSFDIENISYLSNSENILGNLYKDCNNIPMLTGLNETIEDKYISTVEPNIYFQVN